MLETVKKSVKQGMNEFLQQLTDMWEVKAAFTASTASVASFIGVEVSMLDCLNFLIFIDLLLGIIVAIRMKIYSPSHIGKTVKKIVAYYSSIIMISIVCGYFFDATHMTFPIIQLYVTYLMSIECISVMRHGKQLGIKYPPLVDIIIVGYHHKIEDAVHDMVNHNEEHNERTDNQ